jgi:hypothetical protein
LAVTEKLMISAKQSPFSPYDLLGYLIPGGLALYAVAGLVAMTSPSETLATLIGRLAPGMGIEAVVALSVVAYVVGHFLSLLSGMTLERYANWRFGYPSHFLLGLPEPAFFGSLPWGEKAWRAVVFIFLLPVSALDWFAEKVLRLRNLYVKPLDSYLQGIARRGLEALDKRFETGISRRYGKQTSDDFLRLSYHYIVDAAPNHIGYLLNYVALYGFLRTLAFLSVALFWVTIALRAGSALSLTKVICFSLLFAASAFLGFVGFLKFYRRFSLSTLLAMSCAVKSGASAANDG